MIAVLTLATAVALGALPSCADPAGLPNFHAVAPGVYRGAAPTDKGLATLRKLGVHTIIDLRISPHLARKECQTARAMGFTWINLPMGAEPPTQKEVDTLLATLRQAPREPVFVHCQHGADRTGCMIGIYREVAQGWSFARVWPEMRQYGFNPHWSKLTAAVRSREHSRNGRPAQL